MPSLFPSLSANYAVRQFAPLWGILAWHTKRLTGVLYSPNISVRCYFFATNMARRMMLAERDRESPRELS